MPYAAKTITVKYRCPSASLPDGYQGSPRQWIEEYIDEHTRAVILRGRSYYQPQGSHWCFPQAYKLNEHGEYPPHVVLPVIR